MEEPIRVYKILTLIVFALGFVTGCGARAGPQSSTTPPVNMTARELYASYASSARIVPADCSSGESVVWVWDGDFVRSGKTYILPVPVKEGMPTVELVGVASQMGGELLLSNTKISLMINEDTTFQVSNIKFWKITIEPQFANVVVVVLHCYWQVQNVNGKTLTYHHYYRIA